MNGSSLINALARSNIFIAHPIYKCHSCLWHIISFYSSGLSKYHHLCFAGDNAVISFKSMKAGSSINNFQLIFNFVFFVLFFFQVLGCLFYAYYIFMRLCIPLFRNISREPFSLKVLVLCIFNSILPGRDHPCTHTHTKSGHVGCSVLIVNNAVFMILHPKQSDWSIGIFGPH